MIRTRTLALALSLSLAACGNHDEPADHAGHGDHAHTAGDGHVHTAPRGGLLVVLAEETAHVELLLDARTGRLDAYLLGPHAHTPLKSAQRSLRLSLTGGEQPLELSLQPVANPLSGDQVGSTAHFQVTDPRLAGDVDLVGTLGTVEVLGRRFKGVAFGGDA